jgi:hypothetical protein
MNAIMFEHVPVVELPEKWRANLALGDNALVTVRIEEEAQAAPAEEFINDDPAFGMWRNREDLADVAAYVRNAYCPMLDGQSYRAPKQTPSTVKSSPQKPAKSPSA